MSNKILIITTEGCEACSIARSNIKLAVSQSSKKIEVKENDWHNIDKKFIKDNRVKDYPTVLYFKNDKIVFKCVGSYPSVIYLRWIDMYFKK